MLTSLVISGPTADKALTALIATAGPFDPTKTFVGVGSAITPHGLKTTLADITPCPGTLATRLPVGTWGMPYTMVDGRRGVDGDPCEFRPVTSADASAVACVFLADALTGGNLLGYWVLNEPVQLPDQNAFFTIVVRLTVDALGRWDASEAWTADG